MSPCPRRTMQIDRPNEVFQPIPGMHRRPWRSGPRANALSLHCATHFWAPGAVLVHDDDDVQAWFVAAPPGRNYYVLAKAWERLPRHCRSMLMVLMPG
jgi:hypothetical protein